MRTATEVGAAVLAAFAQGRKLAIAAKRAKALPVELEVRRLLDLDILAGHPQRGRAGRIQRRLPWDMRITERAVRNILERLFNRSGSCVSNNL